MTPRVQRDADAGADEHLAAAEVERRRERRRAAARRAPRALSSLAASSRRIANSSPPSRATVSPERRHPCEPGADRDEQLVAGVVAEAVVHDLNPSRSSRSTASAVADASRPRERMVQTVTEDGTVREAREGVEERPPFELVLQHLPVGHVAGVEDEPPTVGSSRRLLTMASTWRVEPSACSTRNSPVTAAPGCTRPFTSSASKYSRSSGMHEIAEGLPEQIDRPEPRRAARTTGSGTR